MKRNMLASVALAMAATGMGGGYSTNSPVEPLQKLDLADNEDLQQVARELDIAAANACAEKVTGPQKSKAVLKRRAQRKRGNASRKVNRLRDRLLRDARKNRRKARSNKS